MKRLGKKYLALLLALCMVLSMMPTMVLAEGTVESGWTIAFQDLSGGFTTSNVTYGTDGATIELSYDASKIGLSSIDAAVNSAILAEGPGNGSDSGVFHGQTTLSGLPTGTVKKDTECSWTSFEAVPAVNTAGDSSATQNWPFLGRVQVYKDNAWTNLSGTSGTISAQITGALGSGTLKYGTNYRFVPYTGTDGPATCYYKVYCLDSNNAVIATKQYKIVYPQAAAQVGTTRALTLADAVAAAKSGDTVKLLKDVTDGTGIIVDGTDGRNFVIDFNSHTYTVSQAPLAGSSGTENQCFQLLKGSTITMKNGAITANNSKIKMIVQNYCNLTLENMTIDAATGTNNASYALSNNCGVTQITGSTTIRAKNGQIAFDACWAPNKGYPEGAQVTLNTTGKIVGDIEFDLWGTNVETKCLTTLNILNCDMTGSFLTTSLTEAAKTNLVISGGTFSADPTAYLAKNCVAAKKAENTWTVFEPAAAINTTNYATLADAVAAAKSGDTVKLLKDVTDGTGIIVDGTDGRNFVIDFNSHTYTVSQAPLAGSSGTENQCFQLLKGSTITMKNGAITANNSKIKMIVQNYCNLTLENMTIDAATGTNNASYALSNNCGVTQITGSTTIRAKNGQIAFDACWAPNKGYPEGAQVTLNTTGKIVGDIEFDLWGTNVETKCLTTLNILNCDMTGSFLTTSLTEAAKTNLVISGGTFSNLSGFAYLASGKTYTLKGYTQADVTIPAGKTIRLEANSGILGTITAKGGTLCGINGSDYPDVFGPTTGDGAGFRTDDAVFAMSGTGIEIKSGTLTLKHNYGTNATPITIDSGVKFTIPTGITFDTWGNITNNGTLTNSGTLKVAAGVFTNNGTIKNLGAVTVADSASLVNRGTMTGNAITGATDSTPDTVVDNADKALANIKTDNAKENIAAIEQAVQAVQEVGAELVNTASTGSGNANVGVSADTQETLTKLETLVQAANTNILTNVPTQGTTIGGTGVKVESVSNAALSVDPTVTAQTTATVTIASTVAPSGNNAAVKIDALKKDGTTPIPIEIKLTVDGTSAQPKVPLLIKLDVTGINEPEKLRIVHQHADESVEVIVPTVTKADNKTYISFYAKALSTFTIVETAIENPNAFKIHFVPAKTNVNGGDTLDYDVMIERVTGSDNVGLVNINLAYTDTYLTVTGFTGATGVTYNNGMIKANYAPDGLAVGTTPVKLGTLTTTVKNLPETTDGAAVDPGFTAKTATTDDEKTSVTSVGYSDATGLTMETDSSVLYRNLTVTLNYGDSANKTATYYAKYNAAGLYEYTADGYKEATLTDITTLTAPEGKRLYTAAPWLDSNSNAKTTASLAGTAYTSSAIYYGNWKTEYAITVSAGTGAAETPVSYTGGAAKGFAAQDNDLVFTAAAANGYKVSAVIYQIGSGTAQTLTLANGSYTIPGAMITGPVTITVAYTPAITADNLYAFTTTSGGATIFTLYSTYSGSKTLVLFKPIEGVTSLAIEGATVYKLPGTGSYTYNDGIVKPYAFAALIDLHSLTEISAAGVSKYLNEKISYNGAANTVLSVGYTYVNGKAGDPAVVNVQCAYDFSSASTLKWTPTEAELLAADVLTWNSDKSTYVYGRDGKVDSSDVQAFLYDHAKFARPQD